MNATRKQAPVFCAALTALLFIAPSAHGASSSVCEINVTYCELNDEYGQQDRYDKVVIRAYDGDDGIHMVASDDTIISIGDENGVTCNSSSACDIAAELYNTTNKASGIHQYDCDTDVYLSIDLNYNNNNASIDPSYSFNKTGC